MADGRRVPIESLSPGDMLQSLSVPGLQTDVPFRAQYEWLSSWGLDGTAVREARVAEVRVAEHDGFYLINRRIKATFEHPFLVRRDEEWGFCSAELLKVGDFLVTLDGGQLDEEHIDSLERVDGVVRTVAIRVPGTNTYLADGAWTHNDADLAPSSSGPGISATGSGSGPSISVLSSSSSSSSSGSKSSGSSFSGSSTGFSNTGASSSIVK
ncbi:MAG: Hint domain-containing protein [Planctomycetota bacterium]|jgi:hypothetical protein